MEARFQKAILGQISTNGETFEKDKLLSEGTKSHNRDHTSPSGDEVLLRAFRDEKLVNSRTRRQVQTLVNAVSKLESEREDMKNAIQDMSAMLKTFKLETTLTNSEIKSLLTSIDVRVQRIEVVQTLSEDTNALVKTVSTTLARNSVKIQNVETSISVLLSDKSKDQCNTRMEDISSIVKKIYKKQNIPSSCAEIEHKENGIYRVKPDFLAGAINVYCDMVTDGGIWIVFQRRKDGSRDFFRGWEAYRNGFGNKDGEFWLGNKYLHEYTNARPTELWIDLVDKDGNKGYARYSSFSIGSEDDGYILSISGYSGNVGDSLAYHNNMKFSTKDSDNDLKPYSCAVTNSGAWWYNGCLHSNLNGPYRTGIQSTKSMVWFYWHNNFYSLRFSEMKFRWKS